MPKNHLDLRIQALCERSEDYQNNSLDNCLLCIVAALIIQVHIRTCSTKLVTCSVFWELPAKTCTTALLNSPHVPTMPIVTSIRYVRVSAIRGEEITDFPASRIFFWVLRGRLRYWPKQFCSTNECDAKNTNSVLPLTKVSVAPRSQEGNRMHLSPFLDLRFTVYG